LDELSEFWIEAFCHYLRQLDVLNEYSKRKTYISIIAQMFGVCSDFAEILMLGGKIGG
jgi:hypothetical protein